MKNLAVISGRAVLAILGAVIKNPPLGQVNSLAHIIYLMAVCTVCLSLNILSSYELVDLSKESRAGINMID